MTGITASEEKFVLGVILILELVILAAFAVGAVELFKIIHWL